MLRKLIDKIANLGSKKAGLSSDVWENCMILKKISIGKRPFIIACYISWKITASQNVTFPFPIGNITEGTFQPVSLLVLCISTLKHNKHLIKLSGFYSAQNLKNFKVHKFISL
jgi:hypothetical protein